MKLLACVLAVVALSGCVNDRDRAQANSAATIWEAADAIERGLPAHQALPAIKANASAIIKSTGVTYPKAGIQ